MSIEGVARTTIDRIPGIEDTMTTPPDETETIAVYADEIQRTS